MAQIISFGETIVDMTFVGYSPMGQKLFEENAGGSASIVAASAQAAGVETALIGKIGGDLFGDMLYQALEKTGVDTQGLVFDPNLITTMCFVTLDDAGQPFYEFVRKPGADTMLQVGEVPFDLIEEAELLHVSGIALTTEPIRSAVKSAISAAAHSGRLVSFDPNYRQNLWSSPSDFKGQVLEILDRIQLAMMDPEELTLITDLHDPIEAAQAILEKGPSLVLVRLAHNDTMIVSKTEAIQVQTEPLQCVDKTGAGAIFNGVFLAGWIKSGKRLHATMDQWIPIVERASRASVYSTTKRGGLACMPSDWSSVI